MLRQVEPSALIAGAIVAAGIVWTLGQALGGSVELRGKTYSRRRDPEWFWIVTSVAALVFGLAVLLILIGLAAPIWAAVGLAAAAPMVWLIAVARSSKAGR